MNEFEKRDSRKVTKVNVKGQTDGSSYNVGRNPWPKVLLQRGSQSVDKHKGQWQVLKAGGAVNPKLGQGVVVKNLNPVNKWEKTITSNQSVYCLGTVASGAIIEKSFFTTLGEAINVERARRGHSTRNYALSSFVKASEINSLRKGLTDAGYPGAASVSISSEVKAVDINKIVQAIVAAGLACTTDTVVSKCVCNSNYTCTCNCNNCTCDCNYQTKDICTCDCNYCTCDCNYSCTCNCNYSDMRLKKDIKFKEVKNGLNIYSFKYVWSGVLQVGVMAQDILTTDYSEAVSVDKNGYYMVDYNKLPV
jgi:hypothetical protein